MHNSRDDQSKKQSNFCADFVVKLVADSSGLEKSFLSTGKPQTRKENKETENKENNQQNRFQTDKNSLALLKVESSGDKTARGARLQMQWKELLK